MPSRFAARRTSSGSFLCSPRHAPRSSHSPLELGSSSAALNGSICRHRHDYASETICRGDDLDSQEGRSRNQAPSLSRRAHDAVVLVTSLSRPPVVALNLLSHLFPQFTHALSKPTQCSLVPRCCPLASLARPMQVPRRVPARHSWSTSSNSFGLGSLTSLHLGLTADFEPESFLVCHDARRRWSGRQGRGTESAQHALARRRRRRRHRRLVLHEVLAGTSTGLSLLQIQLRSLRLRRVQPFVRGEMILLESDSPEWLRTWAAEAGLPRSLPDVSTDSVHIARRRLARNTNTSRRESSRTPARPNERSSSGFHNLVHTSPLSGRLSRTIFAAEVACRSCQNLQIKQSRIAERNYSVLNRAAQ